MNVFLLILFFLSSCGFEDSLKINDKDALQDKCVKKYDSFSQLKINDFELNNIDVTSFIKSNQNYDSISSGYYYYGESYILFDESQVVTILLMDSNLFFSDFVSMKTPFEFIKQKFPCSYKNASDTFFYKNKCKVMRLYDDKFNRFNIFFNDLKVIGIQYVIDENL